MLVNVTSTTFKTMLLTAAAAATSASMLCSLAGSLPEHTEFTSVGNEMNQK